MSDAFVRLYEENVSDVYGYLVYRLGSRADAELSTRATFERAFGESAPFGNDREQDRVRLLTIARTTATGLARDVDGGDPGLDPDLAAALERLDRVERAVLALRYGARLQLPGIARVLDLSEDRARRSLARGLRRLRTELERQERTRRGSAPAGLPDHDQDHREREQDEA
jgi:DNA-directed RNA polymerase specialized sigma24 family protein